MSPLGLLLGSTLMAVAAAALLLSSWSQERPPLDRAIARLRRPGSLEPVAREPGPMPSLGRLVLRVGGTDAAYLPSAVTLRLTGRATELHAAYLATAALGGLLGPLVVVGLLQVRGVLPLGLHVPLGVALVTGAIAPVVVHSHLIERAQEVRIDLRYQLSAYLDVVTMLLAGNAGHEGALEQAAHAGDGRLFRELRRRMREAGTSGRSLVHALDATGRDLGLVELQQVAATASLSAAEGAPVARTLAAKCATLRSTLASEQESEARLRTSRLTPPLVGMSLIFMALIIYPALSFSR